MLSDRPARTHGTHAVMVVVKFALVYLLAAELGHALSFRGDFASFWPPSGIFLAMLIVTPPRRWSQICLGALLANIVSDVGLHGKSALVSSGFTAANALQAVVGASLLRRLRGESVAFARLGDIAVLTAATVFFAAPIGALLGAWVVHNAYGSPMAEAWCVWASGSVLGVVLFTPLVANLAVLRPWQKPGRPSFVWEAGALTLGTIGASEYLFGWQSQPIPYLILPLLIAAAVRLQVCGAALTSLAMTAVAVHHTKAGVGPFAREATLIGQVSLTQTFVIIFALSALAVAAVIAEREEALEAAVIARRELEELNARLHLLSTTDPLTLVNNRACFNSRLQEEVERAERNAGPLSIALLDLDDFKEVNDTLGHLAGDDVLVTVAGVLRKTVRNRDFVARFGGEEFVVLMPDTDSSGATLLAERLRRAVAETHWQRRQVTVSIGVATLPAGSIDRDLFLREADVALYCSKQNGKDRVSVARDGETSSVLQTLA